MHAPRVLGVIALAAIVVAAISFGIVDVTIADGCGSGPCNSGIPIVAITFTALGALAVLVSILPAVSWIVDIVRGARATNDDEQELARVARARSEHDEEF